MTASEREVQARVPTARLISRLSGKSAGRSEQERGGVYVGAGGRVESWRARFKRVLNYVITVFRLSRGEVISLTRC